MSNKKSDKTPAEEFPEKKTEETVTDEGRKLAENAGEAAGEAKLDFETEFKTERDKYLRLLAEYDNYRKRSARERENIYADIRCDTVTKFLPVYDNLMRALEQPTDDEAYRKGVEMTMIQFKEIFERLGITEIETVGKKFDPTLHEAVVHEGDETKGEGEIVQEFRKGFKIGDKVIRFAMVKVAN